MLIKEYTIRWTHDFLAIKGKLDEGLKGCEYTIEHVGSTSVPGLNAKDIIDLDIIYQQPDEFEKIKSGLERLGYFHNGDQGIKDREAFKRSPGGTEGVLDTIEHHLYVCPTHSAALENHLLFRDYLRNHAKAREAYQSLKYEIASQVNQDKERYALLKETYAYDFINRCIAKQKELLRMKLRHASIDDLELIKYWDTKQHVIDADPDDDWSWETELNEKHPWREQLISELDGEPIGFIQIIDPYLEETHYWGDVEKNKRALDIWIGEEKNLNKGYGSRMMILAIQRCFTDPAVTGILIDPLKSNTNAHRFYERLGFEFVEERDFNGADCFVYELKRKG